MKRSASASSPPTFAQVPMSIPSSIVSGRCPEVDQLPQTLSAEIWQYTPQTGQWLQVFKSPLDVPIEFDTDGNPTVFTGRDVGFRGMGIFVEAGGTEALYAGGVTAGSVYDPDQSTPGTYPGPRLLRTVDGINWAPVPQDPGTFLGDIGDFLLDPTSKIRTFRSLTSYNGQLFATVGGFVGSGVIIASDDPAAGNNSWRVVSPPWLEFPVWMAAGVQGLSLCHHGIYV